VDRLKVCITIDTEFSISGAFSNPGRYLPVDKQVVYCNVNGRSEGLGFILRAFEETGIKGTFFVEALNRAYFGNGPMEGVVNDILVSGHDVQLHIHPVWSQVFSSSGWQSKLDETKPNDSVLTRSQDQLESLFGEGADILESWCGYRPLALRTGNLHVNRNVYKAMSGVGMFVSSNIGRGVYEPVDAELRVSHGCRLIEGVYEYPVTSYVGLHLPSIKELKSLTIAGSSFSEAKYLIDVAYKKGIGSVVLLTHPSEFIKGYDVQFNNGKRNVLTQGRLRQLCEYIANNSDRFETVFITQLDRKEQGREFGILSAPNLASVKRIVANKLSSLGTR
jgi:peptidoglycan/xylan/chitin deacetylase (PgdA/CDA1 family)